jgi:hypothetical protein
VRTTTVILMLAVTSSACYQYFPVDRAAPLPEPGVEVRARLNTPQSLDLGSLTINDIGVVEGHVRRAEGDTLSIFSRQIFSAYGSKHFTNGAVFYFDRSELGQLEQRELVPWRTGVAVGAITVGVLTTMYFALDLGGGSGGNGGIPDPQPGRVVAIPLNLLIPR